MPSDHNTRVIKTVWTNVLGLYSQQSTPFKKQMGCLPSVSHVIDHFCLETLWSRVVTFLWARSKPGAVLKLCLKQTSSTPSNLRFLCSAKPMKQRSICIYACSKSHLWIWGLFCKYLRMMGSSITFCTSWLWPRSAMVETYEDHRYPPETFSFGIINLQLHEEHYGYETPAITKFPSHIPHCSHCLSA